MLQNESIKYERKMRKEKAPIGAPVLSSELRAASKVYTGLSQTTLSASNLVGGGVTSSSGGSSKPRLYRSRSSGSLTVSTHSVSQSMQSTQPQAVQPAFSQAPPGQAGSQLGRSNSYLYYPPSGVTQRSPTKGRRFPPPGGSGPLTAAATAGPVPPPQDSSNLTVGNAN
eukprot:GFYU01021041.1.p1 GENE.GFYU01021041.1~~GFYU01021041.1.p1  ORF type:complete len:191 (-),score=17.37 GFYU01021041.1:213-719(-)